MPRIAVTGGTIKPTILNLANTGNKRALDYEQMEAMVAVLREAPHITELEVRVGKTTVRLRRPAPARHKKADKPAARSRQGGASPAAAANPGTASGPKPTFVTATLVGVFRALREKPLTVGDAVKEGQVVGQIEAMRLMNEVVATAAGRIQAVLVQEGQPVEYGQPLFEIVEEVS